MSALARLSKLFELHNNDGNVEILTTRTQVGPEADSTFYAELGLVEQQTPV